jgi:DNA-binding transcriptional ArsR family regulator
MRDDWQKDLAIGRPLAAVLPPPAMLEETGWDILLALHSDPQSELSLKKLGAIVSVPQLVMDEWLSWLEDRRLVAGARDRRSGELRAVLTPGGRELLDRYLSAATDLQARTHH